MDSTTPALVRAPSPRIWKVQAAPGKARRLPGKSLGIIPEQGLRYGRSISELHARDQIGLVDVGIFPEVPGKISPTTAQQALVRRKAAGSETTPPALCFTYPTFAA
jgi:hypothetical protein